MFWLLSLLMPTSLRRESGERAFDNFSAVFKTPQSRGILFKLVAMLLGAGLIWLIIASILSLFNAWFVVLLAMVMGAVVFAKEYHQRRREVWIQMGHCAQCGYDLRATPDRCPECGRDVHLDEPIWKRMRRELEAKLLANAETAESEPLPDQPAITDEQPKAKVVIKPPPVDDTPIPLEGD